VKNLAWLTFDSGLLFWATLYGGLLYEGVFYINWYLIINSKEAPCIINNCSNAENAISAWNKNIDNKELSRNSS